MAGAVHRINTGSNTARQTSEPVIGALMAAEFLIHSGGDTYSEEDGIAWLNETGWRKVAFQPLAGPVSLLVADPARPLP